MQCPEASSWKKACNDEMHSLKKNKTWQLVDLPPAAHVIGNKWVFSKKEDKSSPKGLRFKARLVAYLKGYSQKEGVDYKLILPWKDIHQSGSFFL